MYSGGEHYIALEGCASRLVLEVPVADPRTPVQRSPRVLNGRARFHTCGQLCPCESERARVVREAHSVPDARSSPLLSLSLLLSLLVQMRLNFVDDKSRP